MIYRYVVSAIVNKKNGLPELKNYIVAMKPPNEEQIILDKFKKDWKERHTNSNEVLDEESVNLVCIHDEIPD